GTVKPARFRAVPDGGAADSFHLSSAKAPLASGSYRVKPPPAATPPAARTAAVRSAPVEDPLEARERAEPPPPPAAVPLQDPVELRMQGATQTWDGLRIYWDREPRAAAYEIVASDHQIFGDELAD